MTPLPGRQYMAGARTGFSMSAEVGPAVQPPVADLHAAKGLQRTT